LLYPVAGIKKDKTWLQSFKGSERRLFLSAPTSALKTTFVIWWTGRSRASVDWMLLSIAPGTEGKPGPVTEQTAESYAATFDTNVLGTLLSMKHELRVMLAQHSGSIINVSSTYGHTGAAGASVYAASKHAVEGLTKSAALEAAASGVRVNIVSPGPIETGMLNRFTGTAERKASLAATVPLNRVGRPEEVATTITFLASDKASFITGASYFVDGGKSAR
jgi:NAD(P)-dependent dehydrogenase (short-subunit alcohol dehydrogenase family)